MQRNWTFTGRTVLVAGGARGIGLAVARSVVAGGGRAVLADLPASEGRERARELGDAARFFELDVRDESGWDRCCAVDGLDGVVLAAGVIGLDGPQDPESLAFERWRDVLAVNLDGAFLGMRAAVRALAKGRGGAIVAVASRSGEVGVGRACAYAASKAGMLSLVRSTALYCAERSYPIRVNAVVPGAIDTPMWDPLLGDGEQREAGLRAFSRTTPMRRFGTAAEVADAVAFLLSDASSYTTGATLAVDGGLGAGPFEAASE
jgi:3(or 17)beta-hydroxysteroid dehydrogenase